MYRISESEDTSYMGCTAKPASIGRNLLVHTRQEWVGTYKAGMGRGGRGSDSSPCSAGTQWRRVPKRSATAGQRTAATTEDETPAAPDVGLGAGASAAIATPARVDAASAATTAARKALDAISAR